MSSSRDYVRMARIAEQADRMEDMKEYILQVVKSLPKGGHLSVEERNVLSTAYKSILSPKRNAWRTLDALMQKEKNDSCGECCTDIKKLMEYEMLCICVEVIDVINKYLLVDSDSTPEDIDDRLYYLKMQGDYYRYEAEFLEDDLRSDAVKHSQQCYERALREATTHKVPACNSTLLGLNLNYSVFLYEITGQRELAMTLASKAFDDATDSLRATPEKEAKDTSLILQLLSDNMKLWSSEQECSVSSTNSPTRRRQKGRRTGWLPASSSLRIAQEPRRVQAQQAFLQMQRAFCRACWQGRAQCGSACKRNVYYRGHSTRSSTPIYLTPHERALLDLVCNLHIPGCSRPHAQRGAVLLHRH